MGIKREDNKAFKKVKGQNGEFYAPKKFSELSKAQQEGAVWANSIHRNTVLENLGMKKKK